MAQHVERKVAVDRMRDGRHSGKRSARDAIKAEKARKKRKKSGKKTGQLPSENYVGPKVLRTDHSAQDALGYDLLFEDGTFRVKEGTYSRVIEFPDINFQNARDEECESVFEQWASLWNELDPTLTMKLQIVCLVEKKERFLKKVLLPIDDSLGATDNKWRFEMNRIIETKVTQTRQSVTRRRLLSISCDAENRERADITLSHATETFLRNVQGMGMLSAKVLDGDEVLQLIDSITNPEDEEGVVSFDDLRVTNKRGMSMANLGYCTKDLVAPSDFTRIGTKAISWGDCHGQALYFSKFGNSVRTDMISSLCELPINQIITLNVDPWDPGNAIEFVEGVLTSLKSQKTEYVLDHSQNMFLSDEMLPPSLTDALTNVSETRTDLVSRDQRLYKVSPIILTWGKSEEEREKNFESISEVLRRFSCRVSPLSNLQGQGFAASLPSGAFDIPYQRNMTTAALAAFVPFASVEICEPGGMYMGQNRISKNFIIYDRAHAVAPNGFILGQPGRGKSVTAKNTIMWTYLTDPDADIVVIDPESEYGPICRALNGQIVKVGAGSDTFFNPLDLEIEGTDTSDAPLELKCDMIISAIEMMAKGLTELQKSLIDRCCSAIYAKYLRTHRPGDQPMLSDLYNELKAQPEKEAQTLASTIERYVHGQASLFNHRTNVNLHSRLVTFDVRDNGDNIKPLMELFVLDFIWQRVVRNRNLGRRTWIFIDEIHLLFDNDSSIAYFDSIWSRSRKYGAIPTGITQNVERLLEMPRTRKMLSNSDFLVLLGQSSVDAATIGKERHLSDSQVSFLERATPGCGLICATGRIVEFENVMPDNSPLMSLYSTKPKELGNG